ncbi:hypothetical protein ABK040_009354 [Willaertia magna]
MKRVESGDRLLDKEDKEEHKKIKLLSETIKNDNLNDKKKEELMKEYLPLTVIYKDRDVIVINKPHNLRVYASVNYSSVTLENLISKQFPEMLKNRKIRFPHRLDYGTSGILITTFTKQSCAAFSTCFEKKKSIKLYLALIRGKLQQSTSEENNNNWITIKTFIGNEGNEDYDPKGKGYLMKQYLNLPKEEENKNNFREAITKYTVLGYGKDNLNNDFTKVLLQPLTGRKHQLRLHMNFIGHSIIGDEMYDNLRNENDNRMMLHAFYLFVPIEINYLNENVKKKNIEKKEIEFISEDPFDNDINELNETMIQKLFVEKNFTLLRQYLFTSNSGSTAESE